MKPYYERGGIVLYHGDCRDVLLTLQADVVLTDPPYNARKNYGKGTNDNQEWPEWCEWFDGCLDAMRIAAPDVLCFLSQTAWKNYVRLGKHEIDWSMVWSKPLSLAICAMPFMPHWEPIAYWGTTRKKDKAFWGSDVVTANVTPNKVHPTEKPTDLMCQLVDRFDGTILDPFAGSGTTLVAAKMLGRNAIGIEIEEKWCEVTARRLEATPEPLFVLPPERPIQDVLL